jgi:hypothetical protein
MNFIYVLVLVTVFLSFGNNVAIYAQTQDNKTQKLDGIDKLLTVEEQEIFKKSTKIEILSIGNELNGWADFAKKGNQKLNEIDGFHGYKILKTASVSIVQFRQRITESLFNSIGNGQIKRCFSPRHGVRAIYKNKTVELLICFECGHVYVFNGKGYKFSSISEIGRDYFNNLIENFEE